MLGKTSLFTCMLPAALLMHSPAHAQNAVWHPIRVATFAGFAAPNVTTAQIDACLTTASNIILQDADGAGGDDAACNTQIVRSGTAGTFTATDGNIDTGAELSTIFNTANFLKVVKTITFCGDVIGAFAGCTNQNTRNGMVLSEGAIKSAACGKYIAHEFGHSVGFNHTTYNKNVMKQGEDATLTHLFANQCPFYRSDCMDYDGPGGTAPKNGCVSPALGSQPDTLDLTGVSVERLAQLGLGDRVPVEAMDRYKQEDVPVLTRLVGDPAHAPYHAAALRLLGLVGDQLDANAQELIKYIDAGSSDASALAASAISLGYLANRGSKTALKYLLKRVDDVSSPIADWSVSALALTGNAEGLARLKALKGDADASDAKTKRFGRSLVLIVHALAAHQQIKAVGLRGYYAKQK